MHDVSLTFVVSYVIKLKPGTCDVYSLTHTTGKLVGGVKISELVYKFLSGLNEKWLSY